MIGNPNTKKREQFAKDQAAARTRDRQLELYLALRRDRLLASFATRNLSQRMERQSW